MEFPDLGASCHDSSCKQLDFLPMKCDSCGQIFCRDHIHYSSHNCPEAYKKDNQVPVCPLCNNPITVKKGESPDIIVGRHIDNDCQSDLAKKRRKIYTNRCSFKGCKQKELIPVNCDKCHKNFCLKHRHELDHDCKGYVDSGKGVSRAAAAALNRASTSSQPQPAQPKLTNQGKRQTTMLGYIGKDLERERRERQSQQSGNLRQQTAQAGMTEDEALAHAIQMSMQESQGQPPAQQKPLTRQEQEDLMLAQAIAASQQEASRNQQRQQQQAQSNKTSCSMS